MKSISEKEYIEWLSSHEIGLDDAYPKVVKLDFGDNDRFSKFWDVPTEPERRPYFISCLLNLLEDWDSCFVWRHMGSWPKTADPGRLNDVIDLQILKGLKIPLGTNNIVNFSKSEIIEMITLIFSTTIFGWSVGEDLYIVPEHAKNIMRVNHHMRIYVSFRTEDDMRAYIKGMKENEFYLRKELLDDTFKKPGSV